MLVILPLLETNMQTEGILVEHLLGDFIWVKLSFSHNCTFIVFVQDFNPFSVRCSKIIVTKRFINKTPINSVKYFFKIDLIKLMKRDELDILR